MTNMNQLREAAVVIYEMLVLEAVKAGTMSALDGVRAIDRMYARLEQEGTEQLH